MRRLRVFLQGFEGAPLFDKGELAGVALVDEQVVAQAAFFKTRRGDVAFEHLANKRFFAGQRLDMGDDINFLTHLAKGTLD